MWIRSGLGGLLSNNIGCVPALFRVSATFTIFSESINLQNCPAIERIPPAGSILDYSRNGLTAKDSSKYHLAFSDPRTRVHTIFSLSGFMENC